MGEFQPNNEVDAAVAALAVACPYFDSASGTACLWNGQLKHFGKHKHVFEQHQNDQQQQQQEDATESRDTKRRRSDVDSDANDVQAPPLKVFRFGGRNIQLLGYGLRIDRRGIHFQAEANVSDNPLNRPASPDPNTVDTERTTEHSQ